MSLIRTSVSLEADLAAQFEDFINDRGYSNRSEAIRDLIRERLESYQTESGEGDCVGTLSYVFNHEERELARRLTQAQHHHHDVAVSTLHIHLDHDNCLETVVVRGSVKQVRAFADSIIAQPGVRHGKLQLIPVAEQHRAHQHGESHHVHTHLTPKV